MKDNNKICFISCVNDEVQYAECLKYIENLKVPEGLQVETISVSEAKSIAEGYDSAMKSTDAKYKVYLHQDVFIINKNFIDDIINIFKNNENIGMLGMAGAKIIPQSGIWWESSERFGKVYGSETGKMALLEFDECIGDVEIVKLIDGLIMITQYDIDWRKDIFDGWHFYDISQSVEFMLKGYNIGIPKQDIPWCIHDCGIVNVNNGYEEYRKMFLKEYSSILSQAKCKELNNINLEKHDPILHKKRILIGAPINQRPNILKEFLTSLKELKTEEFEIAYMFVDDNEIEESSKMLHEFSNDFEKVIIYKSDDEQIYNRDENTHHWNEELIWKVASFKDNIIKKSIELNYDYLFFVDSDCVVHPETINQLVADEKSIVSEIFWTKWETYDKTELPQVWISDQYTQYYKHRYEELSLQEVYSRQNQFFDTLKKPGVYEVGGLGACTLIKVAALKAGLNFKEIKNISFIGEDRHFCIRAQALGFDLYVDTNFPAYHIYRESYLSGVCEYKEKIQNYYEGIKDKDRKTSYYKYTVRTAKDKNNKLTLSMVIKNEADHYLKEMLEKTKECIDEAVIIDDASNDNSIEIVKEILKDIPVHVIRNEVSKFSNEITLRKQQWEETIKTNPDWILFLDADQIFENKFAQVVGKLINQTEYDVYSFRLYDFWDRYHYRDDINWCAHNNYRPYLMRYQKDFNYIWRETAQHCGSYPENVLELPNCLCNLRLKHYGWASEKDRREKYDRYMQLDPYGKYGSMEAYKSILDETPNLALWEE